MNWKGLNQWQQWVLGVGGGLISAFIIWSFTKLFGRKMRDIAPDSSRQTASPVMTQHFQPVINIHTASTSHDATTVASRSGSVQPLNQPLANAGDVVIEASGMGMTGVHGHTARVEPVPRRPLTEDFDLNCASTSEKLVKGQIAGILFSIANRQISNLSRFRLIVREARSFDFEISLFREGFGFKPIYLINLAVLLAGDVSKQVWLVRIAGDHLEVGSDVGTGILRSPQGMKGVQESWLLTLSVEAETYEARTFDVIIQWNNGSRSPEFVSIWPDGYPA